MECARCGGLVTWKGPWYDMYKKCQDCGNVNGDTVEEIREALDEDQEDECSK
jgi:hypothetical protein